MFVELFFIFGALYILFFGGFRHPFHSFLSWVISWFVSFIIVCLVLILVGFHPSKSEDIPSVITEFFLPGIACFIAFILGKMGNFQQ